MQERPLQIINKLGLHARAATKLANLAKNFSCKIDIVVKDKSTDAKSIMSLMLLAAAKGTDILVRTNGEDEGPAMDAISQLINNRFDEEE